MMTKKLEDNKRIKTRRRQILEQKEEEFKQILEQEHRRQIQ